ncbi:MAG: 1-acyl-sn-glycerol-3-phosphate acyltransferase [Bdellovibrionales bacterium]|nr:1-acyl-sn-glycerol-3-phosphate acyltransferase [Bdellovibrionales bacterium]
MRVLLKWSCFSGLISAFFLSSAPTVFLPRNLRERARIRITRFYARWIGRALGIGIKTYGRRPQSASPLLILANHLSYLDILVLFSSYPCRFITSVEVRETPFLGWLCRSAGCLFVERREPRRIGEEVRVVASALAGEQAMVLFPEGTSGNGETVLPFKTSFLQCAIEAGATVAPVCLVYESIDGRGVDSSNRDDVYWYGDMSFFPHLKRVMRLRRVEIGLHYLDAITVGPQTHRRDLGEESYALIENTFRRHSKAIV